MGWAAMQAPGPGLARGLGWRRLVSSSLTGRSGVEAATAGNRVTEGYKPAERTAS